MDGDRAANTAPPGGVGLHLRAHALGAEAGVEPVGRPPRARPARQKRGRAPCARARAAGRRARPHEQRRYCQHSVWHRQAAQPHAHDKGLYTLSRRGGADSHVSVVASRENTTRDNT